MGQKPSYRKNKRSRRKNKTRRRKTRGGSSGTSTFQLTDAAGFGSISNILCRTYIDAKDKNNDFFIDNGNWTYTYKNGWHDYFKSLKTLPVNPPENIKRYRHPYNDPSTYGLPRFSFDKYSTCAKEIFVLNDDLAKRVKEYIDTMGKPYNAVYVRMGDKVSGNMKESDAFPINELVDLMKLPEGSKLFIMTDDYNVKTELEKLLPSVKMFTLTPPENKGASANALRNLPKEEMKKHAEELFMSIQIMSQCEKGWVWNNSNLGRFMKLLSPDNIELYPASDVTPDKIVSPEDTPL